MLKFKFRFLIEPLSIGLLIIILLYLPQGARIVIRDIFSKLKYSVAANIEDCKSVNIIKYIHPLRGQIWTIKDSSCLVLKKNDLIIYQERLIGKVIDKKGEYNTILPIFNKDTKIKVKIKTKDNKTLEGIYRGMGVNSGFLYFIPSAFNVERGEKVYTLLDEKNNIPENLIVGFVQDILVETNQTVTLMVNADIDINNLSREKLRIMPF